jgi:hypothetical protein
MMLPFVRPPYEVFNPLAIGPIVEKIQTSGPVPLDVFLQSYMRVVYPEHGNITKDLLFSLSVTPWVLGGVERLNPGFSRWLLHDAIIVILLRKDILQQAISYTLADQSGFWHSMNGEASENRIDGSGISRTKILEYLDLILWGERQIFTAPLRGAIRSARRVCMIDYETLAAKPESVCLRILKMLGVVTTRPKIKMAADIPSRISYDFDMNELRRSYKDEMPIVLPSRFQIDKSILSSRRRTYRAQARAG